VGDGRELVRAAREQGLRALDEPTAKVLLGAFGIATPARSVVSSAGEALALAALRPPFVLKAVSPQIVHKSDVGAVRVGLRDERALAQALDEMRASLAAKSLQVQRWLVEEMAPAGVECVVGGVLDAEFGPMVMAGLGGVFVELMRDVSFRICPIDRHDALEMLEELRGAPLLRGARGREPVSLDALVAVLLAIGGEGGLLMSLEGEIAEIDINPLIVGVAGAVAADARIMLTPPPGRGTA
jgi:hypothetical protein